MFDIGFSEMLIVGTVALIVVGPKDLPGLFRNVGQFVGKAKGMAREFSSAMNAAADEAGVSEINKTIKAAANPQKFGADKIREATGMSSPKEGSETEKLKSTLSAERAANKAKIDKAMADVAEKRIAAEKAQASAEIAGQSTPEPAKPAAKPAPKAAKPAAPKAAKKAAPKAAKKPAPKAAKAPKAAAKDAK